jgi:hypothetical protein
MTMTASARANKPFGYKALAIYANGRTHQPVRHNFKTRDEAIAYAQKWIDANADRPSALPRLSIRASEDGGVLVCNPRFNRVVSHNPTRESAQAYIDQYYARLREQRCVV